MVNYLENISLYNGDCLEIMDRLITENTKVDCIITSPPYNLGGDFHTFVNGKRVTYGDYGVYNDNQDETEYQNFQIDFLNKSYDILKDNGVMFYNHKNRIVNGDTISPTEWIKKSKFFIMQIITINLKSTPHEPIPILKLKQCRVNCVSGFNFIIRRQYANNKRIHRRHGWQAV